MNKHLLVASAAGAGLMAASVGVHAASFGKPGIWANPILTNYYTGLVPSGDTAADSTIMLEVNMTSGAVEFSYATPMFANSLMANVGTTFGSASYQMRAWSNSGCFANVLTTLVGTASMSYTFDSAASAFQAFSQQVIQRITSAPTTGVSSSATSNFVTCDVSFQAFLDSNNNLTYQVLTARPVNWVTASADVVYTGGSVTASTTAFTAASSMWNGGLASSLASALTNSACSACAAVFLSVSNYKLVPFPATNITSLNSYTSASMSYLTNATYPSAARLVGSSFTCTTLARTKQALAGSGLTKVW